MYEKVEKIINDWDPIELFPLAPKDEYSQEINKIISIVQENPNIDMNVLGKGIRKIFIDSFGEKLIFKNNEDEIAEKILAL
ncbi:DUF1871 family protein [Listeria monocytogenes]|uniref:DUF1871 family protein n=1 Tax=Listeria monocytogenes TaxID=1639 RepID=UPI00098664AE|nr:DUF1871 family protein [Listeria monocytogenes]EAF3072374.1 DUF1871 family protein [Listeria monocytogenes serotype 1/2a]EAD6956814.1 DUF1871 family protein [Listeria monocytogenes]EAE5671283.1 DUF1871 family protein [Listeria monocytogenes]EAE5727758.1 DUF1871 family protein [Listeria monocytogenes]EAF4452266.1 DUF1871 family protein [Listeria monocytogenes serotype 1/2a]